MKLVLIALAAMLLAACSGLPTMYDPSITANQIKAIAADKNAGVVCGTIPTPMGQAKVVVVNLDQRVIDNGGISADSDCRVTITNARTVKEPAK